MTATKDDVTKYTKPELIKALRAAWAREARLAKKIEKHEGAIALARLGQRAGPVTNAEIVARAAPVFPWEQK